MKVFVVLEEDCGFGPFLAGVFASREAAESFLAGPYGSGCYLLNEEGKEVVGETVQESK